MSVHVSVSPFGILPDGRAVESYALTSRNGVRARILSLGGIIQSLRTPDRDDQFADVVLGYPDLAGYIANPHYFGAIIGRYANRIADGAITIDGVSRALSVNEGASTLHGGARGFDKAVWTVLAPDQDRARLRLTHISADGDQGFPGALRAEIAYELTDEGFTIEYSATTTATTPVSLTNHTYWNLSGGADQTIRGHCLQVDAEAFTPVDPALIPTGDIRSVAETVFDLRKARVLGAIIDAVTDPQIAAAQGLDHNFVPATCAVGEMRRAAILSDPASGRSLEVWTNTPGLQVYTGNHLGGTTPGVNGGPYPRWGGVALETQAFPNAPNCPAFPPALLSPHQTWRSTTHFTFPSPR